MLNVGLTGGIGSGKSFVAEIFKHLSIPVYNADQRAKYLIENNAMLQSEISKTFGTHLIKSGQLDRKALSSIVFNNPDKLKLLEAIVHPAVRLDYFEWVNLQRSKYVIREAAILFESGAYKDCQQIIVVHADEAIRIDRVMKRDAVSKEDVIQRMKNQWSDAQRESKADFIIQNNGDDMLLPQVMNIHRELMNEKMTSK